VKKPDNLEYKSGAKPALISCYFFPFLRFITAASPSPKAIIDAGSGAVTTFTPTKDVVPLMVKSEVGVPRN
jgi:hypothetical protein